MWARDRARIAITTLGAGVGVAGVAGVAGVVGSSAEINRSRVRRRRIMVL